MRINHIKNEIKKLSLVIENLIINYKNNFNEYDSKYKEVQNSFIKREKVAQETENWNMLYDINQEKRVYTDPLDSLKSLAQFQNELMLVKHVALLESMIINTFKCLIDLLQNQDYKNKYFIEQKNFSDSFEATNKISELTGKKINLKKLKFWKLYETMKIIRNTIAHGDPLFVISYKRLKKFNENINIISAYSEKNEDTNQMYPSLLHPTYSNKSQWYCHLSDDIHQLSLLNKKCLEFTEETRELFLSYGREKTISDHELYGCRPYNKNEQRSR